MTWYMPWYMYEINQPEISNSVSYNSFWFENFKVKLKSNWNDEFIFRRGYLLDAIPVLQNSNIYYLHDWHLQYSLLTVTYVGDSHQDCATTYTLLQNKRWRWCGAPLPPPPPIIFEGRSWPQQTIYHWNIGKIFWFRDFMNNFHEINPQWLQKKISNF